MDNYKHVFSPFRIGNVEVKNRIEVAPMLSSMATWDGYVTRELIEFYRSLAKGGAGIVTLGDTAVDDIYARGHFSQMHLGNDGVITGLNMLVEAVQRYGAKISVEIDHSGRLVSQRILRGKSPIGPSSIISAREELVARLEGRKPVPVQEMDQEMIDLVIEGYVAACNRCLLAGFEMIMIHGGHGQLLAQFASPLSNKRIDKYGGKLENRARFAVELLTAIRKKIGNKLAIEYRISADELSPEGMHLEETIEFIKIIEDKIDLVHASLGGVADRKYTAYMSQPTYFPHEFNVHRAEAIKKAIKKPVTCVGSIINLAMADRIIAEGKADIVAMARANMADHDMVNKSRRGEEKDIRPCLRCGTCGTRASDFLPVRCAVNPVAGREAEYKEIPPAPIKKKVVIVGGGPAGMQAALTAVSRGHSVTLFEKEKKLGGSLPAAAAPEFKPDMKRYLEWIISQVEKSGVTLKLGNKATSEAVKSLNPDVVIIAAGARPIIPDIPGIKKSSVVTAADTDLGLAKTGKAVVVAGAGLTGCETALHLARKGSKVILIDIIPEAEFAKDTNLPTKIALMDLIEQAGVKIMSEVKLTEVADNGVVVTNKAGKKLQIAADTVVLALGVAPVSKIADELKSAAPEFYVIGDCANPRNIMAAVHDGFNTAVEI